MHRFHLPPEQGRAPVLTLREREAHHAIHVLRLARGAPVVVLDGAGEELHCEVQDASHDLVHLKVIRRASIPPLPWQITLLQAVPKARMIEDIIQKATELGVHRIVPLLTERVVMHLDAGGAEAKAAKWRLTAIEAIKQCGNPWLPRIDTPITPQDFLACGETFDLSLVAALADDRPHPRAHLEDYATRHGRRPRTVSLWIGPEGDFTPHELAAIKGAGVLPIELGRLVLRCETAALCGLSLLNFELSAPAR